MVLESQNVVITHLVIGIDSRATYHAAIEKVAEQHILRKYSKCNTAGHGGAVVTHSPPTSEVGSSNSEPCVEKLVVAYQWSAVYSTEP